MPASTTAVPQLVYPEGRMLSGFFLSGGPRRQVFVAGVEEKATLIQAREGYRNCGTALDFPTNPTKAISTLCIAVFRDA